MSLSFPLSYLSSVFTICFSTGFTARHRASHLHRTRSDQRCHGFGRCHHVTVCHRKPDVLCTVQHLHKRLLKRNVKVPVPRTEPRAQVKPFCLQFFCQSGLFHIAEFFQAGCRTCLKNHSFTHICQRSPCY